jgi:hypothetical protein
MSEAAFPPRVEASSTERYRIRFLSVFGRCFLPCDSSEHWRRRRARVRPYRSAAGGLLGPGGGLCCARQWFRSLIARARREAGAQRQPREPAVRISRPVTAVATRARTQARWLRDARLGGVVPSRSSISRSCMVPAQRHRRAGGRPCRSGCLLALRSGTVRRERLRKARPSEVPTGPLSTRSQHA